MQRLFVRDQHQSLKSIPQSAASSFLKVGYNWGFTVTFLFVGRDAAGIVLVNISYKIINFKS